MVGQVNRRLFHLHHATASDVGGECRDVVEVRVGDEVPRECHEVPRLGTEVESDFEFGDAPVGLDCGAGVAIDT